MRTTGSYNAVAARSWFLFVLIVIVASGIAAASALDRLGVSHNGNRECGISRLLEVARFTLLASADIELDSKPP